MRNKPRIEVPILESGNLLSLDKDVGNIRVDVEWTTKSLGIICDLDLTLSLYNDRGVFVEKIDSTNEHSRDNSCNLMSDIDVGSVSHIFMEAVKIDISDPYSYKEAIILVLDGGPRNYQHVQSISANFYHIPSDRPSTNLTDELSSKQTLPLCKLQAKPKKDYGAMALAVIYKDGWHSENKPKWIIKAIMQPLVLNTSNEVDSCLDIVVHTVPSLYKFKSRLFNSVRDICAALSSVSLPKLKKKFLKSSSGLPIMPFTEVLFKQLHEAYPKVVNDGEASHLVAMIEEMFYQIDYNGDKFVDWDEFTSFIIQNSLIDNNSSKQLISSISSGDNDSISSSMNHRNTGNSDNLDEYIVEYSEDISLRDRLLSNYKQNSHMTYVMDTRRILIIPQEGDHVMILDEGFKLHSLLYPKKIQTLGSSISSSQPDDFNNDNVGLTSTQNNTLSLDKFCIYDIIYLSGRDMYAFTSSDHTIVICKEHTSLGGNITTFFYHDKIYHRLLHKKLCWSTKHNLLCSITTDNTIHGWNIDKGIQVFQVSRHNDMIMDFICVDDYDSFITCSMDGKIVMWSTLTRRVKGIFAGHIRGVRSLSYHKSTLLSSGFECEARTWDIASRDPIAILKGHRHPIRTSKLMCDNAHSEKDYRAITVDESGEFRLWNIFIKDRAADPVPAETLQIFVMTNPETPIDQIRFLAVPYNQHLSKGYYSDFIACSSKLLRFVPEKHAKEFFPPSHSVFNEATATLYTCAGKSIHKYDISKGKFICSFQDVYDNELSIMLLDGVQGRRIFVGCSNGDLLLINSVSGSIIDKCSIHIKEITSIIASIDDCPEGQRKQIYTCSMDGRIRSIEELGGKLHIHNTIENAFGDDVGVASIKAIRSLHVIVASSSTIAWGIWNEFTFKKIIMIYEEYMIMGMEVVGVSQKSIEQSQQDHADGNYHHREHLITIAVALPQYIQIYSFDFQDVKGVATKRFYYTSSPSLLSLPIISSSLSTLLSSSESLLSDEFIYITNMKVMCFPSNNNDGINNSKYLLADKRMSGGQLVVSTDDGQLLTWSLGDLQLDSEKIYLDTITSNSQPPNRRIMVGSPTARSMMLASAPVTPSTAFHTSHTVLEKLSKKETRRIRIREDIALLESQRQAMINDEDGKNNDDNNIDGDQDDNNHDNNDQENQLSSKERKLVIADNILPYEALSTQHIDTQNLFNSSNHNPLKSAFTSNPLQGINIKYLPVIEVGGEYDSSIFNILSKSNTLSDAYPDIIYQAHSDSITSIISLSDHGCIGTVSLDGYHRIWNADHDCLGELLLPNVTEHMKKKRNKLKVLQRNDHYNSNNQNNSNSNNVITVSECEWKFIMERLPVTIAHQKQAKMLVDSITKHTIAQHDLTKHHNQHQHRNHQTPKCRLIQNISSAIAFDSSQRKSFSGEPPVIISSSPTRSTKQLIQQHALFKSPSIFKSTHNMMQPQESSDGFLFPLQTGFPDDICLSDDLSKSNRNIALNALVAPLYFEQQSTVTDGVSLADMIAIKDNQLENNIRLTVGTPSSPSRLASRASNRLSTRGSSRSDNNNSSKRRVGSTMRLNTSSSSYLETVSQQSSPDRNHSKIKDPHSPTHDVMTAAVVRRLSQQIPASDMKEAMKKYLPNLSISSSTCTSKDDKSNHNKRSSVCSLASMSSTDNNSLSQPGSSFSPFKPATSLLSASNSLWSTPDVAYDCRAHIAPAFSETSINNSLKDGLIDGETYHMLRRISAKVEKVAVYEKTQPLILLRNPALSVSFEMPSNLVNNCGEAEFGSQKDLYKNAVEFLDEKSHLTPAQVRNVVALERVETSVRQIKSMVHILPPLLHEEIDVTKNSNNLDGENYNHYLMRVEKERMRRRLEASAALVPIDSQMKRRSLDLKHINNLIHKLEETSIHEDMLESKIAYNPFITKNHSSSAPNSRRPTGLGYHKNKNNNKNKNKLTHSASNASINIPGRGDGSDIDENLEGLEKKFAQAIRDEYRNRTLLTSGILSSLAKKSSDTIENSILSPKKMCNGSSATTPLTGKSRVNSGRGNSRGKSSLSRKYTPGSAVMNSGCSTSGIALIGNPPLEAVRKHDVNVTKGTISSTAPELAITSIDTSSALITASATTTDTPLNKLLYSVSNDFSAIIDTNINKNSKVLTTRFLLPFYKIDDVRKFVDIFTKVDEDFSGDLDIQEWVKFFSTLNRNFSAQEARMVFMKIDADGDGQISLNELVPVVFSNATKEQLRAIIHYVESEIIRKHTGSVTLTHHDVEQLFECYDAEGLGFISVLLIKDRIKTFNLAENVLFMIMDLMKDLGDDEMVNIGEFARLMKPFTSKVE